MILFVAVKKRWKSGLKYIHAYLIIEVIFSIIDSTLVEILNNTNKYEILIMVYISVLISIFVWYLPNLKYFEKRSWYFGKNKELSEEAILEPQKLSSKFDKARANKRTKIWLVIMLCISVIVIIFSLALVESEYEVIDYLMEQTEELEEKANFLDENIVLIIEGDDEYYYTYDQIRELAGDRVYYYWAYTDVEAEEMGYKKWK